MGERQLFGGNSEENNIKEREYIKKGKSALSLSH
jgi:hypothetical protein